MADAGVATVLFVEDEMELRLPVVYSLEFAGFRVLAAKTGEEALEVLRDEAGQVDWLFTDIRLPGLIDGWRVADEFRFSYPLRPVIFATGAVAERPRERERQPVSAQALRGRRGGPGVPDPQPGLGGLR